MKKKIAASVRACAMLLLFALAVGYIQAPAKTSGIAGYAPEPFEVDIPLKEVPLSDRTAAFIIPVPVAAGRDVIRSNVADIDISNTQDGYVMVRYLHLTAKALKVIITSPGGTEYVYSLRAGSEYEVYPLSDGNGIYRIAVYENVIGNKYSMVLQAAQNVTMADEFAPFIRPNQYVNYNAASKTVAKAAEITKNAKTVPDKIEAIYNYIIKNISYDQKLAATVAPGYIPDVDAVLKSGKGICFDYAAVTTAMLRSQGIPTKLVVGYTGTFYHAWISAYSDETGWVDGVIYFDGKGWKLMDPTFASFASGGNGEMLKYISNDKNYTAKYLY